MKLKYMFETVELDDEIVKIPVNNDNDNFKMMMKLNESADEMFRLLQEDITEEAMITALLEQYDAPYEEVQMQVHAFVDRLNTEGLLKKPFVKPEMEIIKYKHNSKKCDSGHSHCKSPFGRDHSHE